MADIFEEQLYGAGATEAIPIIDSARADEYLGYTGSDQSIAPFIDPSRADEYLGHVTTYDPATGTGLFPFELADALRQPSGFLGGLQSLLSALQGKGTGPGGKQGVDLLKLLAVLAMANKARKDRTQPRETGGGTTVAWQGPKVIERKLGVGPTGQPIFTYARNGGLMQAYASGGPVAMENGGFVMTKKAVDGAGGFGGLRQLVPEAEPIRGPGTGTSDSIPAYIRGRNKVTPARVSNGEAYVPPGRDTEGLYALMKSLERNA